jgi:hypothetical protein
VLSRDGKRRGNSTNGELMMWAPKVDLKQRGNELAISADLPLGRRRRRHRLILGICAAASGIVLITLGVRTRTQLVPV